VCLSDPRCVLYGAEQRGCAVTTAIRGKLLIDGTGCEPLANPVIVVEGDTISSVGVAGQIEVPRDARIIDLPGMTLVPGLIDAHIHLEGWQSMDLMDWMTTPLAVSALRATVDARRLLEAGFTAVRCLGGAASIYLKQAIEEGAVVGPRIVTSGRSFIQTGGGPIHGVCQSNACRFSRVWGRLWPTQSMGRRSADLVCGAD
jgi:imidazolonepropionase-like amidohydrolase